MTGSGSATRPVLGSADLDTDRVAWRAPASFLQQQWYHSVDSRMSNYNVLIAWRLLGPLDTGSLRQALRELVVRHEIMRTCLDERGGAVEQRVHHYEEPPLWQIDLSAAREPEADLRTLLAADVGRPFALREPPLWRAVLARLDGHDHVLALVLHHAVCDGWSSKVMERDLAGLYRSAVTRERSALPALPIQFGDFATWERSVRDPALERQWRARLTPDPASTVQPPAVRDRPPFELVCHPIPTVPAVVAGRLAEFARQHGATLPAVLYSSAILSISSALGEEVTFGLAHANRGDLEVQPMIGPVFDYLPIRVDLRGSPTSGQLMDRIRSEERAARARMLPLGLVEQAVLGGRPAPRTALFDLVVNFIPGGGTPAPHRAAPSAMLRFEPFTVRNNWARIRVDRGFYGAGRLSFVLRLGSGGELGGHVYGQGGPLGWPGLARLGSRFRTTLDQVGRDPTTAYRSRHRGR